MVNFQKNYELKTFFNEDDLVCPKELDEFKKYQFKNVDDSLIKKKESILKMIEEIKKKAEQYLESARKKAPLIEKEAFNKGFAQGEKSGLEIVERKTRSSVDSLYRLMEELGELKEKIFEDNKKELIELALSISEKIVHEEILLNKEVVKNIAEAAIRKAVDGTKLIIRVNPSDFDMLLKHKPKLQGGGEGINEIIIIKDEEIVQGGCVIETNFGKIDARVDRQHEVIRKKLTCK